MNITRKEAFIIRWKQPPFPIAINNEEMINNIKNFDLKNYLIKCDEFLKEKYTLEDGQASKRVVKLIVDIMKGKKVLKKIYKKSNG